jgi:hypothetical protein
MPIYSLWSLCVFGCVLLSPLPPLSAQLLLSPSMAMPRMMSNRTSGERARKHRAEAVALRRHPRLAATSARAALWTTMATSSLPRRGRRERRGATTRSSPARSRWPRRLGAPARVAAAGARSTSWPRFVCQGCGGQDTTAGAWRPGCGVLTRAGTDEGRVRACGCDNPPRKVPYYRLRPIHFGH